VVIKQGGTELDRAVWTKSTKGASLQRSEASLHSPIGANVSEWCITPAGMTYGIGDRGTPGAPNGSCSMDNPDAGSLAGCKGTDGAIRALVTPRAGDLIITEIMASPSTGNNGPGEWFEVLATSSVDLNGLELSNEGTGHSTLTGEECLSVVAGQWLLFARSNDVTLNGGLPTPLSTFNFALADSGSSAYPERAIVLLYNGIELARASWASSVRGRSRQLSDSPGLTADGGDSAWCFAPTNAAFGGGDLGTPGAENFSCN
jgi:hypothetical protein